jgi:hypothetical protein
MSDFALASCALRLFAGVTMTSHPAPSDSNAHLASPAVTPSSFSPPGDAPRNDAARDPSDDDANSSVLAVAPRDGVVTDPGVVHLLRDAAVKINALPSRPGYSSGMRSLQTHLHVEAWVRNVTYVKHVWVDVHAVSDDGKLIHQETCSLRYERPAGDGGDVFLLDTELFQGSVASEGSVDLRPDLRHVEFRLYVEMNGRVWTDAVAHRCELAADSSSSR